MSRYTKRPPASSRAARVAWDEFSRQAAALDPPTRVDHMWFDRPGDEWNAYLDERGLPALLDEPYLTLDGEHVRDRLENPHSYDPTTVAAAAAAIKNAKEHPGNG